jgi:hypothetical protein
MRRQGPGLIRWLRLDYHNAGGSQAQRFSLTVDTIEEKPPCNKLDKKESRLAWPRPRSERVKAVTRVLSRTTGSVTAVAEILEALRAVSHAYNGKPRGK